MAHNLICDVYSKISIPHSKGLCKVKKFQKHKKNWIELTPPTHHPFPILVLKFHHDYGQNNQIIITNNF